jgi:hypothetical protein
MRSALLRTSDCGVSYALETTHSLSVPALLQLKDSQDSLQLALSLLSDHSRCFLVSSSSSRHRSLDASLVISSIH